jgi:aldehyde:ferredoxin oxidoreductase
VDFSDKVDRRHVTLDAVRYAIETEDKAALMDSLIICKFLRGVFEDFYAEAADMLHGSRVGRDRRRTTRDSEAHRRHQAAVQSDGRWTLDEDTLPARFLDTPLPSDPTAAISASNSRPW